MTNKTKYQSFVSTYNKNQGYTSTHGVNHHFHTYVFRLLSYQFGYCFIIYFASLPYQMKKEYYKCMPHFLQQVLEVKGHTGCKLQAFVSTKQGLQSQASLKSLNILQIEKLDIFLNSMTMHQASIALWVPNQFFFNVCLNQMMSSR